MKITESPAQAGAGRWAGRRWLDWRPPLHAMATAPTDLGAFLDISIKGTSKKHDDFYQYAVLDTVCRNQVGKVHEPLVSFFVVFMRAMKNRG